MATIGKATSIDIQEHSRAEFVGDIPSISPMLARLLGAEGIMTHSELLNSMPTAVGALRAIMAHGNLEQALQGIRAEQAEDAASSGAGNPLGVQGAASAGAVLAVRRGAVDNTMRLDSAALMALNLMPARMVRRVPPSGAAGQEDSGQHLLGQLAGGCWSKGGPRVLARWLMAPLTDRAVISARAEVVEALVASPPVRDGLRDTMRIPDIASLRARLARKRAGLMDILRLYSTVNGPLPSAAALLSGGGSPPLKLWGEKLSWLNEQFAQFKALVETVVEDSAAAEPRIKPGFSPELRAARDALDAALDELVEVADRFTSKHGSGLDIKFERDKARGYVFRVTRKHDKAVRKIPGVTICATLTSGVTFNTPKLKAAVADHSAAGRDVRAAEAAVLEQVLKIVRTYSPVIESLGESLGELDALCGMAALASDASASYVRPTIRAEGDEGGIAVRGARHALLESDPSRPFIPNHHEMARGSSNFAIITGPNMGGKSTYIRQLGVLMVLAQIGSFVPAATATVPVLDCILARIGAGDSQLEGVSTFMAEMVEAAAICETATKNSLVIIDELGRGTSTYDGFGLAWALSEHLVSVGCYTLFATHFHEMTALEHSQKGVCNQHVHTLATEHDVTMLYSVRPGPAEASFGVHVARMTGCPQSVVATADAKAKELEGLRGGASHGGADGGATALDRDARSKALVAAVARVQGGELSDAQIAERVRALISAHVR